MVKVIDTSVAVKWLVEEEGRAPALAIFEEVLSAPGNFAVPELFYFELAHVFNSAVFHPTVEEEKILEYIWTCGIQRFSMTPELAAYIRSFQKMGLSGYDAAFVAVARMVKGTWVTFDRKAHKRVASLKLSRLL